jgi:hypothetical protein
VLSLGATVEAVTHGDIPFDRLPHLGGPQRMRAFARDELRGERAAYADAQYEWPLSPTVHSLLFVEGAALTTAQLHGDFGFGVHCFTRSSTYLNLELARSFAGVNAVFLQVGAL